MSQILPPEFLFAKSSRVTQRAGFVYKDLAQQIGEKVVGPPFPRSPHTPWGPFFPSFPSLPSALHSTPSRA